MLSDGGHLIAVGGKSSVAYITSKGDSASGMRLAVGGSNVVFSPDYDPTALHIDTVGKLVNNGDHKTEGQAFGEIEVMKMFTLPGFEIKEELSVLSGRIDANLSNARCTIFLCDISYKLNCISNV